MGYNISKAINYQMPARPIRDITLQLAGAYKMTGINSV